MILSRCSHSRPFSISSSHISRLYSIANFYFGAIVIIVPITFFDLGNERYFSNATDEIRELNIIIDLIERKQTKNMQRAYDAKKLADELKKKEEVKTDHAPVSVNSRSELKDDPAG